MYSATGPSWINPRRRLPIAMKYTLSRRVAPVQPPAENAARILWSSPVLSRRRPSRARLRARGRPLETRVTDFAEFVNVFWTALGDR